MTDATSDRRPRSNLERDRYEEGHAIRGEGRFPIHTVLDNVRSAFNVGSIIRTSDAARVAKLHLCGITARPPHREIARTSLGATRYVPWQSHERTIDAVTSLKERGVRIVALEVAPSAVSYLDCPVTFPLGLVVGHEVTGVSEDVLALADDVVHIPMWGVKNSLNVATSYGIIVFELLRRYASASSAAAPIDT